MLRQSDESRRVRSSSGTRRVPWYECHELYTVSLRPSRRDTGRGPTRPRCGTVSSVGVFGKLSRDPEAVRSKRGAGTTPDFFGIPPSYTGYHRWRGVLEGWSSRKVGLQVSGGWGQF